MKRLLRVVLACLGLFGPCPFQVEREPRLNWKDTPIVEGCQRRPAETPFDTLADLQLDCAAADGRPGHSEYLG
jgi:hypothetical protein